MAMAPEIAPPHIPQDTNAFSEDYELHLPAPLFWPAQTTTSCPARQAGLRLEALITIVYAMAPGASAESGTGDYATET